MGLGELTRQASSFLQDKYRTAKFYLTDVTPAESLTEEATNGDPRSPDAKTMMRIAEAAFYMDDYWRIVDVLHRRLYRVNWEEWRQSYKALAVLESLLTHGPEGISEDFQCDVDVIEELGTFKHVDERGFDWGSSIQRRSQTVLKLLSNEQFLEEARWRAFKVSREIQGFGNDPVSPPSSFSSKTARTSSFGTSSQSSSEPSPRESPREQHHARSLRELDRRMTTLHVVDEGVESPHVWDVAPAGETGSFLRTADEGGGPGWRFFSRSFSDAAKVDKNKFKRQLSSGI